MPQKKPRPSVDVATAAAALAVVLSAVLAVAQYQVNTQVGQVGQVNRRVGGELYGNNTNMGSVRYASQTQTNVLPSEARYAAWRSAALPSEITMNARAIGPLPPNGAISYIPTQSPTQAAMKKPAPPLYPATYDSVQATKASQAPAPQAGFEASSIRYSSPQHAPAAPMNASMSTGQLPTQNIPAVPAAPALKPQRSYVETLSTGSIKYPSTP